MTGVPGNKFTLAFGKQTQLGVAAVAAGYKLKVTGGNIMPARETIQLAETDASRQQGKTVVVGGGITGSPEFYVRPDDFGLLALAFFGAVQTAGAGPDKTHTFTPADAPIPLTCWKNAFGLVIDQYIDVFLNTLKVKGGNGQPLTVGTDVIGLDAVFNTTDDPAVAVSDDPYVYPEVTILKGGVSPGIVEAFELNFEGGGEALKGDGDLTASGFAAGQLQVSGTATVVFESKDDYYKSVAGDAAAVGFTTTLLEESLSIKATRDATTSIEFPLAGISITEYPLEPDPGGAPVRVQMGFRSQPQATIGDYAKAIVKNDVASY